MPPRFALFVLLCHALAACDGGRVPLRPNPDGPPPTYYADIAPIVRRECLGCHVEGGIGPFRLDHYEALRERADLVVTAVETGFMPPWMPDPECRSFEHERGLTDDERGLFRRWLERGMREGSIEDLPPAPPGPAPFAPTHVARMREPYAPDAARPDDYRCFVLDFEFDRDLFLTGRHVIPGASSLVHHVLVYGVREELLARVEAADAADPGPGYTCFAGPLPNAPGVSGDTTGLSLIGLGGWVPGQVASVEREGRAIYVPEGSRVVMQVHYNTLEEAPQQDDTVFEMALTEEEPEFLVTSKPLAILDLSIPAGAPAATERAVFRYYGSTPLELTAVTPHMHLLGTDIRASLVPAIGSEEPRSCLLDVPQWDFAWQQSYRLRADDQVSLATGEGVELTCVYDNSASHQPVVNGEQVEPRDVTWGEGTLDEMCLMYVQHELPWTGPPATGCAGAAACLEACTASDTECLLACEQADNGCRPCLLRGTLGCARDACLGAFIPAASCIQSCILSYALLGGSFDRCMRRECPAAYPAVLSCVSGVVEAGTCDAAISGCGISR